MAGATGAPSRCQDRGFTLIEMLTVMLVISVLSAIAIPVLLTQRGKGHDTATKRDLGEVAKQVTAAFAASGTAPTVGIVAGEYVVAGEVVGPSSPGVIIGGSDPAVVDVTGWTVLMWCMTFTHPAGDRKDYRFSAQRGLEPGACASPITP